MRNTGLRFVVVLMLLICSATNVVAWSIFSSSSKKTKPQLPGATVAEFSIDGLKDPRGAQLLENARRRIAGAVSCWNEAYERLFASCADMKDDKEMQSRLAWYLSSCYQQDSGRPPLPQCDEHSDMVHCRKRLTESEGKVYLEFFLKANILCLQLQDEAFRRSMEKLVNDLAKSSMAAHRKLEVTEEKSDHLCQVTEKLGGSLSSMAAQAENLTLASMQVGVQIDDVLGRSKTIIEQSKEIAAAQAELNAGQAVIKDAVDSGIAQVEESYRSLGDGMDKLKEAAMSVQKGVGAIGDAMSSKLDGLQRTADDIDSVSNRSLQNQMQLLNGQAVMRDAVDAAKARVEQSYQSLGQGMDKLTENSVSVEKGIRAVGDAMSSKMDGLQRTAKDIGIVARRALAEQIQLLDGQEKAMRGLNNLYSFQKRALEESRETIQMLADLGRQLQEDLLAGQEEIRHAHGIILQNSNIIINSSYLIRQAQEEIIAKQTSMFAAFNAAFIESQFGKSCFSYCCLAFFIYVITSTKQTFRIRGHLYLSIGITMSDFSFKFWILSNVRRTYLFYTFVAYVVIQIIWSILTFKDYDVLNHNMRQTLAPRYNAGGGGQMGEQEEVDSKMDRHSVVPRRNRSTNHGILEGTGENSGSRRYNLRPRNKKH